MQRVCPKGPVTKGIDIYHGDYISDITKVMGAGFMYAFLKAWENAEDSSFAFRWNALHGKMIRGAYDFFHPEKNPLTQANQFLAAVGKLEDGDLPHTLDWESTGGTSSATDRANGLVWLTQVEKVSGKTPIIYGSPAFLQALSLDGRFTRYGLWLANYGVTCPSVPSPWSNTWQFWQSNGGTSVPGMRGPCDTDVYNGTLDDLKKFIAKSKV